MLDELYVIDKIILVKSSNVGKMLKFATTLSIKIKTTRSFWNKIKRTVIQIDALFYQSKINTTFKLEILNWKNRTSNPPPPPIFYKVACPRVFEFKGEGYHVSKRCDFISSFCIRCIAPLSVIITEYITLIIYRKYFIVLFTAREGFQDLKLNIM